VASPPAHLTGFGVVTDSYIQDVHCTPAHIHQI
jgi:hypothetical protein